MSTPIKNVVIAGAGGNLGGPILSLFLKSPLNITVLTRPESKSEFPSNVKVVKTDYTKDSLVPLLKGQDAVLSFLGSPGLGDAQLALIDAAAEAGVKRFVPSEFGHNTGNDKIVDLIPIFGGKRKFVERIKTHPSLTWTAVITGLFFDWGFKRGTIADVKNGTATVWDDGNVPFSTTNLHIIGQTLVKVLTDPTAYEDSSNKYIYLASHTTTQNEIVAAAEKASGKKLEITKVDGAQRVAEGKELLAKGEFTGIRYLIAGIAFSKINGDALADYREYGIFNDKHGIKDISLEEDVKNLVASI
jgi:uncharacterized protein YbjT (DUF2867 family)